MEKLEIFPLKIEKSLVLITTVIDVINHPERVSDLFNLLDKNNIKVHLFIDGGNTEGQRTFTFVLHHEDYEKLLLPGINSEPFFREDHFRVVERVGLVRILGAHFDIRPGVASLIFNALEKAGIEILTNSTTITSSLMVIRETQLESAVNVIRSIFRLPGTG